jgi:hypothetical protein
MQLLVQAIIIKNPACTGMYPPPPPLHTYRIT